MVFHKAVLTVIYLAFVHLIPPLVVDRPVHNWRVLLLLSFLSVFRHWRNGSFWIQTSQRRVEILIITAPFLLSDGTECFIFAFEGCSTSFFCEGHFGLSWEKGVLLGIIKQTPVVFNLFNTYALNFF